MALSAHSSAYTGDVNDWTLKEYQFGPFAAAAFGAGSYPLFVLPEACDIEKITMRWATASSSGTCLFRAAASGTAVGSGTALTGAELTSGTADTPVDVSFLSTAPQIDLPSGTLIGVTSGGTVTNLVGLMITIVVRKKPDRRDYTSDTTKVDKTKYFYTKK